MSSQSIGLPQQTDQIARARHANWRMHPGLGRFDEGAAASRSKKMHLGGRSVNTAAVASKELQATTIRRAVAAARRASVADVHGASFLSLAWRGRMCSLFFAVHDARLSFEPSLHKESPQNVQVVKPKHVLMPHILLCLRFV